MLIVLYAHLIYMFSEVTMYKIDYEALADDLIEQYPVEQNPELYSLYTSMRLHLMKVYKLKETTAIKLMTRVLERRLNIHFYRDYELSRLSFLRFNKTNNKNKYLRILYWTQKLPIENAIEIYDKYNDITSDIVKRYMHETGKLSDNQIADYEYARNYYHAHHEAILKHKREYRARKKKEKENEKIHNKINQVA